MASSPGLTYPPFPAPVAGQKLTGATPHTHNSNWQLFWQIPVQKQIESFQERPALGAFVTAKYGNGISCIRDPTNGQPIRMTIKCHYTKDFFSVSKALDDPYLTTSEYTGGSEPQEWVSFDFEVGSGAGAVAAAVPPPTSSHAANGSRVSGNSSSVSSSSSSSGYLYVCPEETPKDFWNAPLHTTLIDVNALEQGIAVASPEQFIDHWSPGHVKLPCLSSVTFQNYRHWDVVKAQLSQPMMTIDDVITAIEVYSPGFLNMMGKYIKYFFTKYLQPQVSNKFMSVILPKLQQLALELPQLITQPMPWLQPNSNMSMTMSKRQIACLLANQFFNTFPKQDKSAKLNKHQHMFHLFYSETRPGKYNSNFEKVRCLLNYFDRVTSQDSIDTTSSQVVSFHRRRLEAPPPEWSTMDTKLTRCLVKSDGFIEKQNNMLQVDFANKCVGGSVYGHGAIQEEIRFVTHPELLVSIMFTPELLADECLIVQGAESYSECTGYGSSFRFVADYIDPNAVDSVGRKLVTVVAIDALPVGHLPPNEQFKEPTLTRELNKAYVGFQKPDTSNSATGSQTKPTAVATGNWGCGSFGGNPTLKFFIQWMAASYAGRDMLYLTFNDIALTQILSQISTALHQKAFSVSDLWNIISMYCQFGLGVSLPEFMINNLQI